MEIKAAAEKHIPEITSIWMEFMYLNSDVEPADTNDEKTLEKVSDHFKHKVKEPNVHLLVALKGNSVVGYSLAEVTPGTSGKKIGHIYDVAVASAHRNQGIGRELLGQVKDWLKSQNAENVELSKITRSYINDSYWKKQGL